MTTTNDQGEFSIDALLPPEMAQKAEAIGVKKAEMDFWSTLALSVLAGAFIAIGAVFATTLTTGTAEMPYGVSRLLAGFGFSLGLILVIVGGAELFTGNNLIILAFTSKKISLRQLVRNWSIVYFGNFIGSILTALFIFFSGQYQFGHGAVGLNMLNIADSKAGLSFFPAVVLGMLCNTLVCLAVWLCYSARSTTDKILAIIPPIVAFVAVGFEHSVANMYFIPVAIFVKNWAPPSFFVMINKMPFDYTNISWGGFFNNLIPVTIGNIIGGTIMVGLVYWFIYLRKSRGK
jgi:formate transporter